MRQADVVLFVEHVSRELDIACVIRHLAWQRFGMEVGVASLTQGLEQTLRGTPPSVIAVPYFYSRRDMGIREILMRWPGVRVVNLAYEQLVSPGNQQFKVPRDPIAREHVLHLAVGDFFREFLVRHGVPRDRVLMSGSLACSLYLAPYRRYFESQRARMATQYGLEINRPWVFFPENYGAAFFSDREVERRVREGCDRRDVEEYRRTSRDSLTQVADWCRHAALHEDVEIIIRPRPATSVDTLRASFREAAGELPPDRLHFIKQESVRQWTLACDTVVSSFSTTLVEAAVADRPAYLLMPSPLPRSMHCEWHDLAPKIATADEFQRLLREGPSPFATSLLRQWAQLELLSYGDPISKVAAILAAAVGRDCHLPPVPSAPVLDRMRLQWKRSRRQWKQRLLTSTASPAANPCESPDAFDTHDVDERTAAWEQTLDLPSRDLRACA
ncbi:MAG: hypothetical protein FJ295_05065 [Planctomycetes bacterium]|nr:hypothetical protein [Planctomycetota bacterium]